MTFIVEGDTAKAETPKWSNCLIEMARHYWRLRRQGARVATWWRRSDFKYSPFHCGWALYDPAMGAYVPFSFKPLTPVDVPWYMAWTRLLFRGHVVRGDDAHQAGSQHETPTHG